MLPAPPQGQMGDLDAFQTLFSKEMNVTTKRQKKKKQTLIGSTGVNVLWRERGMKEDGDKGGRETQ